MFKSAIKVVLLLCVSVFIIACMGNKAHARTFTEGWKQVGVTSFYHRSLNGNLTANGERYRHFGAMTAAHRYLPFGTKVQVTDKDTGKSIVVRINDRGPFHGNRVLDLSGKAAETLGIVKKGVCNVEVKVLSLPEKYTAKAKPTNKVNSKKLSSSIDSELASINKPSALPPSHIDAIEELLARTLR